jgi:hypothetical protein
MTWWMLVAIVMTTASIADAGETQDPMIVALQLKSEARVPVLVLEEARAEVVRIFSDAGVEVRWTDAAPHVTVTIVPQVLGYATATSPVMGVARRTQAGSSAQIFFAQVQHFARTYRLNLGTMLAHVIAHEVGHLLLSTSAHSPTGVMQAGWDREVIRDAARGSLTFTEAQAARMRALY